MFVSGKIAVVSSCGNYAVITGGNYADIGPNFPYRTSYRSSILEVLHLMATSEFPHHCPPSRHDCYVGVKTADLKSLKPEWLITESELLEKYQIMQREGLPITDKVLLAKAKELWSERLASLRKKA